jgi:alkaline phosphatase D
LRSGPMLGEVGVNDALIWAQARDTSLLTLRLYVSGTAPATFVATPTFANGLCVSFHVTGLAQGISYEYDIASQHGSTPRYHLKAGLPNNARRARIAFGSCFGEEQNNGLTIFGAIANDHPDAFVMTGDNCYFRNGSPPDWQDEDRKMLAQLRHRNNSALRKLIPNTSTLGIWDDHDFGGPDDNDSSDGGRNDSLSVFKRIWAQRAYGLPAQGIAGIFSNVRYGPVEIFLLDGRYHRVEHSRILGSAQLDWLKTRLLVSTAPIKLIVSGSVVLPEFVKTIENGTWEGWQRDARDELEALLDHIEAHGIKGVVFASGDLHLGYLMHRTGTDLSDGRVGPEYWEVVASPLAQAPWGTHVRAGTTTPTYDPGLLEEVVGNNYGLLDIDLDRTGHELSLSLKNPQGMTYIVQSVALNTLRVRPAIQKTCAVVWPNGKAYFFKGAQYVRYNMDAQHEGVEPGYPKSIRGYWKGLAEALPRGIDSAVVWPNGRAYFFSGNGYVAYALDPEGVIDGYPKYIALNWGNWPSHWRDGIDAALVWDANRAYFFKGAEYIRYNIPEDRVEPGYPKPIAGIWPGLAEAFPEGVDSAIDWGNGFVYFFSGGLYVRYRKDPNHEGVDAGYPKPINGNWPGLNQLG